MGNASAKDVHNCVDVGDLGKLEKILEAKAELIDALSKEGETPIFRACANGNIEAVELLLDFEADITIPCSSCMNMTCLHIAATDTESEIVELLLENGADPNAKTSDGATPLHCAFQYCAFDIAKLLIQGGASADLRTQDGQTPFEVSPVDSPDVQPFSTSELAELKSLALGNSAGGGALVIGGGVARRGVGVSPASDADIDLEQMKHFFKEAGLGTAESKLCAVEAMQRGVKTGKRLAASIHMGYFTLQDLMVASCPDPASSALDELDYELVSIAVTRLIQDMFFVADDGPHACEPAAHFTVSRSNSRGNSTASQEELAK